MVTSCFFVKPIIKLAIKPITIPATAIIADTVENVIATIIVIIKTFSASSFTTFQDILADLSIISCMFGRDLW